MSPPPIFVLQELVKFHSSQNKAGLQLAEPLVINTCGWTKGTGLELLYQIAKIANPDFIVDLSLVVSLSFSKLCFFG